MMYEAEDLGNPKNYALNSELSLWASVLELAVHDYLHGSSEARREATNWIFGKDDKRFNSFENVCGILDLDSDAVKERIRVLTPKMYKQYRMNYRDNRRIK